MSILRAFLAALVFSSTSYAQTTIPPGQFAIGGTPVACGPAPTFLVGPQLGDIAKANQQGIWLNYPLFQQMPLAVQLFTYAHECGHVNQILRGSFINEDGADLFAMQLGKSQGFLNIFSIQTVCVFLWSSGGDWTHRPGPVRCQNMLKVFPSL
jgi:hypothetical protein